MASSRKMLRESCDGLTIPQRLIVEDIYSEFVPLIEASLDQTKIQQLFTGVEQAITASGQNRSALGKAADVPGKVNAILNKVGSKLQDTAPVKFFDQKFEQLQAKIATKFPNLAKQTKNLGDWVKANPGKSAAAIGILTAIASLAAGPVGGAIAGQVLKGSQELLKGSKLSTAIGKGAKAAALGWLTGKAVEFIGNALTAPVESAANELGKGVVKANYSATIDEIGGEFGNRFEHFSTGELYGKAEDIAEIRDYWKEGVSAWKEGAYPISNAMFKQAAELSGKLSDPEYVQQVAATVEKAKTMKAAAEGMQSFFNAMAGVAQGAATGVSSKNESSYVQDRPLTEGQVYLMFNQINEGVLDKVKQFGKNLTTRVTADKLSKAWNSSGNPTDSDQLANFLQKQGVDAAIISQVFKKMKLPAPGTGAIKAEIQAIKNEIMKLKPAAQQKLLAALQKQAGATV